RPRVRRHRRVPRRRAARRAVRPSGRGGGLLGESLDGRASVAVAVLVVAAIWIVMFLTPGFLGAPVLLSGSMLAAWSAIVTAIWGGSSSNPAWSIGETGRSTAILQYQDPIGSSGFPIESGMSVVDLD